MLEQDGWWVVRAAGSLGDADLVALKSGESPKLIEIKSTTRGPYHGFGPRDRADLAYAAEIAGAEAWLVHWPPHKQPKWIPESGWPNNDSLESDDGARRSDSGSAEG